MVCWHDATRFIDNESISPYVILHFRVVGRHHVKTVWSSKQTLTDAKTELQTQRLKLHRRQRNLMSVALVCTRPMCIPFRFEPMPTSLCSLSTGETKSMASCGGTLLRLGGMEVLRERW